MLSVAATITVILLGLGIAYIGVAEWILSRED